MITVFLSIVFLQQLQLDRRMRVNCCWNSSDISDMSDSEFQVNFCCYPEVVAAVADVVNVVSVLFVCVCAPLTYTTPLMLQLGSPTCSLWKRIRTPHSPPSFFWWILGVEPLFMMPLQVIMCACLALHGSFSDVVFSPFVCVVGQWYIPRFMILEPSPSETPLPSPSSSIKVWKPWKPRQQGSFNLPRFLKLTERLKLAGWKTIFLLEQPSWQVIC